MRSLAVMLQHGACVVSNAGTILLDALVNDRPAVCVLYDEGAPPGETWAAKNVLGVHYRELMSSTAFYRAATFDEVTAAIERALAQPARALGGAATRRAGGGRRVGRPRRRAGRRRDRAAGRRQRSGAADLGHRQRLRARSPRVGGRPADRRARRDARVRRAGRGDGGCGTRRQGSGRRDDWHPAGRVARAMPIRGSIMSS